MRYKSIIFYVLLGMAPASLVLWFINQRTRDGERGAAVIAATASKEMHSIVPLDLVQTKDIQELCLYLYLRCVLW